jgi:hypothetical protein
MIVGTCVFADGMSGITDASMTLRPAMPWTRQAGSTTAPAVGSMPHCAGADRVVVGPCPPPHPRPNVDFWAGPKLNAPGQLFDGAYVTNLAHSLQSLNHPVKIIGLAVVAEIDARRRCGIDRARGEVASRSRLEQRSAQEELAGVTLVRARHETLQVWCERALPSRQAPAGTPTPSTWTSKPPSIVTRTRCGAIRSV